MHKRGILANAFPGSLLNTNLRRRVSDETVEDNLILCWLLDAQWDNSDLSSSICGNLQGIHDTEPVLTTCLYPDRAILFSSSFLALISTSTLGTFYTVVHVSIPPTVFIIRSWWLLTTIAKKRFYITLFLTALLPLNIFRYLLLTFPK